MKSFSILINGDNSKNVLEVTFVALYKDGFGFNQQHEINLNDTEKLNQLLIEINEFVKEIK